jgi:hypothetical protein
MMIMDKVMLIAEAVELVKQAEVIRAKFDAIAVELRVAHEEGWLADALQEYNAREV